MSRRRFVAVSASFLLGSAAVHAQLAGEIKGRVVDPAGAAVAPGQASIT